MANLVWKCILPLLFLRIVAAQDKGQFTNPSSTGSASAPLNKYEGGDNLNIAWEEYETYTLLSLGIFQPGENVTVEWLVSDLENTPNPFRWTVQTFGFKDISQPFAFYIVNGTNFGSPFRSVLFNIEDPASSSSSSSSSSSASSTSRTVSSTQTAATTTTTNSPTPEEEPTISAPAITTTTTTPLPTASALPSSSGLSTGAKAGIGAGVALAFIIGAAVAWFLARRRSRSRQSHPPPLLSEMHHNNNSNNPASYYNDQPSGLPPSAGLYEKDSTLVSKSRIRSTPAVEMG